MISKRHDFKNIKNFSLFYGIGNSEELSKYDLTIVEPLGQNEISVKEMQAKGTLVIAYVSVVEIIEAFPHYKFLREEDFLKIDNNRVMNKEFNTYLINLKSERWISILMHHIGNLILNSNYDGIFLDTMGDVEFSVFNEQQQESLICGAVDFITKIREQYEDIIIIQNNGFNKLIESTFNFIDGVCWENPRLWDINNSDWIKYITGKLTNLSKEQMKVLLLYEENSFTSQEFAKINLAEKIAKINNFLIYKTESYC
ncbi:endo alpha-1,4 polygalactosaminidase [Clostridium algoriphilum]|uniref:endo alpha-1,4 polygalactosaminidase n=1 Tax=Clostridium algoriphilum TaxID=198347 RepID=UPI001CF4E3F8|nr:endo alpha-1,4 polygalactosaminidase [Clostridium algoriphilum]MCB2292361.1 endo alpha-1,4 polygalactosaminidase [Clostridium algoriphilum]